MEQECVSQNISNKINILHFKIKWSEFLATLANLIDSESKDNIHLYFKCNIYDFQQFNNNLFNKVIKEKKENEKLKNMNKDMDEMEF